MGARPIVSSLMLIESCDGCDRARQLPRPLFLRLFDSSTRRLTTTFSKMRHTCFVAVLVVVLFSLGVQHTSASKTKLTLYSSPGKEERLQQAFDKDLPLIYLHVKKTGGSTLCGMAKVNGLRTIEEWSNCFWHGERLPTTYLSGLRQNRMFLGDKPPYDFVAFEINMRPAEPWGKQVPFRDPLSPFWRNAVHIFSTRDPITRFMSYIVHIALLYDRHDMPELRWNATMDENHVLIDKLMHFEKDEINVFADEMESYMLAVHNNWWDQYRKEESVFGPFTKDVKREIHSNGPGILTWSLSKDREDVMTAACNLRTHYSAIFNLSEEKDMTAFLMEKVLRLNQETLSKATTRYSGLAQADNLLAHLPQKTIEIMHMVFAKDICLHQYAMRLQREHAISLGYKPSKSTLPVYKDVDCAKLGIGNGDDPVCDLKFQKAMDGSFTSDLGKLTVKSKELHGSVPDKHVKSSLKSRLRRKEKARASE
eukprot:TRINITY_DN12702_c0_g1_i1.p1 TRINITY_DN12702_c0_g1~~TRINITY_DN12702_c0_g1_i1.p1  ORF type:complete len:480 (-),score=54.10 TRINITY_DN12702_c0_g1_i1:20-1459(-)